MNWKNKVKKYLPEQEEGQEKSDDQKTKILQEIYSLIRDTLSEELRDDKNFLETFISEMKEKLSKDKILLHKKNSNMIGQFVREIIEDKMDSSFQTTKNKFFNGLVMRELPRVLPDN
jgi:hypothetical protein